MHGIVVAAAADYLNVVFKIVMTSCPESPYMTIPDGLNLATKGRPVLWLGYYQDTTDKTATGRPGHYQSLVPVSSVEIPLGHRDEEDEVQVSPNTTASDIPISKRLESETKLLDHFSGDAAMTIMSLERIKKLIDEGVCANDLLKTSLSKVLYMKVRPQYSVNTQTGKCARKILLKLLQITK